MNLELQGKRYTLRITHYENDAIKLELCTEEKEPVEITGSGPRGFGRYKTLIRQDGFSLQALDGLRQAGVVTQVFPKRLAMPDRCRMSMSVR